MAEDAVLALQRVLAAAALAADPGPFRQDPAALAAARGLGPGHQEALRRFRDRLLVYRDLVRSDLTTPVAESCPVTRALLEAGGLWSDCLAAFLESRSITSIYYRDLSAAFLGWLHVTGWGLDRWPFLLQLAHFELLHALVAHLPGEPPRPGLKPVPESGDRLVLDRPTQLLTYQYQVHLATCERPEPAPGITHLLAYRDRQGRSQWLELTPAAAALLLEAQHGPIVLTALQLGLEDTEGALQLLADLQVKGAVLGFGPAC
jgi:hypothetical protein